MNVRQLVFVSSVIISSVTTVALGDSLQTSELMDNAIQEAQAGSPELAGQPVQGTSRADLQITEQIQKELLDTEGLSIDARAARITTFDGHVTLRGVADTTHEKRLVGQIAAHVVPVTRVSNQMRVKETVSS
jgi:osmotically-inducible protein OsmY